MGLAVKYVALKLSHHRTGVEDVKQPISRSKNSTHVISEVATASALYSASVLDRDTAFCFRDDHDIKWLPKYIAKPVVDFLSSTSPPQSESV